MKTHNNDKTIRIDCLSFHDFRKYKFNRLFRPLRILKGCPFSKKNLFYVYCLMSKQSIKKSERITFDVAKFKMKMDPKERITGYQWV